MSSLCIVLVVVITSIFEILSSSSSHLRTRPVARSVAKSLHEAA